LRAHRLHEAQPGRREWSRDASPVRDASGGALIRASYYSSGRRTASGEVFQPGGYTAANRTLPFGTMLRLTNPSTGRTVMVRVNDRGPFVTGRSLDVSRGAAVALGMIAKGTATLRMERV
jgi:rare lipoprotein A